jgi:hypothetical protein
MSTRRLWCRGERIAAPDRTHAIPGRRFFAGVFAVIALIGVTKLGSRYIGFQKPQVPHWSREDAFRSGLFRSDTARSVSIWDTQSVIDSCLEDFHAMRQGDAELGPIYQSPDSKKLVLLFACPRDKWFRDVTDRAIAYVYDLETRKLIAKFWVPMA